MTSRACAKSVPNFLSLKSTILQPNFTNSPHETPHILVDVSACYEYMCVIINRVWVQKYNKFMHLNYC